MRQDQYSLPATLADALTCREGDEIQHLCDLLKAAMERFHGTEYRIQIDHLVVLQWCARDENYQQITRRQSHG